VSDSNKHTSLMPCIHMTVEKGFNGKAPGITLWERSWNFHFIFSLFSKKINNGRVSSIGATTFCRVSLCLICCLLNYCYDWCNCTECCCAECHSNKCTSVVYHSAKCCSTNCHSFQRHSANCHSADCYFSKCHSAIYPTLGVTSCGFFHVGSLIGFKMSLWRVSKLSLGCNSSLRKHCPSS
jgi:hypothetical protein